MKAFEVCSDKMILKCLGNIYTNLETVLKVGKKSWLLSFGKMVSNHHNSLE